MSTVSIKTNTASLMKALSVTFTDKTKVLTEIIQNSRRAGANGVNISYALDNNHKTVDAITISDDGHGIKNMQDIFTIGGSNWNEKTKHAENPYGIGSIAMLYACESLEIISNGKYLNVNCQAVIDGKSFSVSDYGLEESGTCIIMKNTVFDEKCLNEALRKYAQYSNIEIMLNNEVLPSYLSLTSLQNDSDYTCLETPLGTVAFCTNCSLQYKVILQDLEVHSKYNANVYFFANQSLKARMPDRDKLVDEKQALLDIEKAISTAYSDYLTAEKLTLKGEITRLEQWVKRKFSSIVAFAPALLNDIPVLPAKAFTHVCTPCKRELYDRQEKHSVKRNYVNDTTYTKVNTEAPVLLATLHAVKAQVLNSTLDKDHWFYDQATAFDEDKAIITVENPRERQSYFDIDGNDLKLTVADKLSVSYGTWTHIVKHGAFLIDGDNFYDLHYETSEENDDKKEQSSLEKSIRDFGECILVDIDDVETILLQFSSFRGENEEDDNLYLQETVEEVISAATIAFGVTAADFIARVLPSLPFDIREQLKSSPVTIEVNELGIITTKAA